MGEVLRADADAGVLDHHPKVVPLGGGAEGDLALLGELGCVRHEVEEDLTDLQPVRDQPVGCLLHLNHDLDLAASQDLFDGGRALFRDAL